MVRLLVRTRLPSRQALRGPRDRLGHRRLLALSAGQAGAASHDLFTAPTEDCVPAPAQGTRTGGPGPRVCPAFTSIWAVCLA